MNPADPQTFSARQIAAALGITKRAVCKRLQGNGGMSVQTRGGTGKAWEFCLLPADLQTALNKAAQVRGFRDGAHLLRDCGEPWHPALPLAEIDPGCLDRAAKLQRAMGRALLHLHEEALEAIGLADFKAEFGYEVSASHWRTILDRTLERDGGRADWGRLEIFLDERLARKVLAPAPVGDDDFATLREAILCFHSPTDPNGAEIDLFWIRSIEWLHTVIGWGKPVKETKTALVNFLWRIASPWIAKSPEALRRNLDRKYQVWLENNGDANALRDGREMRRGMAIAPPIPQGDVDYIQIKAVVEHRGELAPAARQAAENGRLTPATAELIMSPRARKSQMPGRLYELLPGIRAMAPHHQGPRAANMVVPPMDLSYDDFYSLDQIQADDFTFIIYAYVEDEPEKFRLTRCQAIVVIDVRSTAILGFALHPFQQYNALCIRTAFVNVFKIHGIPRELYLERGIWKRSKLITGGPKVNRLARGEGDAHSLAECEIGLRQLGIKFRHAIRPRSKVVEKVGDLIQDDMTPLPGYCGRFERFDRPEELTRQMREVQTGHAHPSKYFLSVAKLETAYLRIFQRYNATKQQGKRLPGLSPDEAFQKFWPVHDPPVKFGPECQHMLAAQQIPVEVEWDGIRFKPAGFGQKLSFYGEETGKRPGAKLIAWFDPLLPETCTFTDRNGKNPFTMKAAGRPSAIRQDAQFEIEVRNAHAHWEPAKTRYRTLDAKFEPVFRQNRVDRYSVQLGQEIAEQKQAATTRNKRTVDNAARLQRLAEDLGTVPSALNQDAAAVAEGKRMMEDSLRNWQADQAGKTKD